MVRGFFLALDEGRGKITINTVSTSMQITLSGQKTIYEDIKDTIRLYIVSGVLKENEKLPSVRELALQLSVNPNTVARAYDELTQGGFIYSLPKKGCFVASGKEPFPNPAKKMLRELLASGVSLGEIESALEEIRKEGNER